MLRRQSSCHELCPSGFPLQPKAAADILVLAQAEDVVVGKGGGSLLARPGEVGAALTEVVEAWQRDPESVAKSGEERLEPS